MSITYAIILAGGSGSRMQQQVPKQFLMLQQKTILQHTLENFNAIKEINRIIVVCSPEYQDTITEIASNIPNNKLYTFAAAGTTRQLSSYNAINCHKFKDDDILLFHDAARPFVSKDITLNVIAAVKQYGAASVYVPAVDTITVIENDIVKAIPDRATLFNTQTPQGFTFKTIYDAHMLAQKNNIDNASDDVLLAINNNISVHAVPGDYNNIKITNPADLVIAEKNLEQAD